MKELFSAYAKAFPEIEGALKDSINPHFKSKYADLTSTMMAVKPALAKYGLSFVQISHIVEGGACAETLIMHTSGESLSCGKFYAPATKQDAQGYGSAMTYARRYSFSAAFGVCPEDDDGNAASAAPANQNLQKITASQVEELRAVIDASKYDVREVCERKKVNSLNGLSVEDFRHLMTALGKKG